MPHRRPGLKKDKKSSCAAYSQWSNAALAEVHSALPRCWQKTRTPSFRGGRGSGCRACARTHWSPCHVCSSNLSKTYRVATTRPTRLLPESSRHDKTSDEDRVLPRHSIHKHRPMTRVPYRARTSNHTVYRMLPIFLPRLAEQVALAPSKQRRASAILPTGQPPAAKQASCGQYPAPFADPAPDQAPECQQSPVASRSEDPPVGEPCVLRRREPRLFRWKFEF
ncbi:hypothetical protein FKP32DRAFT_750456 [Trametes sanguinea]|nr:hypothetical protein FKP32DRAFT_750456 [Trametes sanguinea]